MKICLFATNFPEYMIELANALSKEHDVTLFYATNIKMTDAHIAEISDSVRFEPFVTVTYKSIRDGLKMWLPLLFKIWKIRPDVLHIQNGAHHYFPIAIRLLAPSMAIFDTIHDPYLHSGDKLSRVYDHRPLRRCSARKCAGFFAHGEVLKTQLSTVLDVEPYKVCSIPHGNFGIYKRLQQVFGKEKPYTYLFFGRIWPYKGLDVFIDAALRIAPDIPKARFLIVGTGEELDGYLAEVTQSEYRDRFEIHNRRVPIEEVGKFFEESSAVVLPYKDATQSGVIPVAYAYGKPVIATQTGSLGEAVISGLTGLLVQPNNPAELAKAMRTLAECPETTQEYGSNAQQFANEQLGWERVARLTAEHYQKQVMRFRARPYPARLLERLL